MELALANRDLVAPYEAELLRIAVCVNSHTTAALRLADAADGRTFKVIKDTLPLIPRHKSLYPQTKVIRCECSRALVPASDSRFTRERHTYLYMGCGIGVGCRQEWARELGIEVNGIFYLSKQRILEACPSLGDPVDRGIPYTIVRHQLTKLVPDLMSVLSEADNCKHDTYRNV